MHEAAAKLGGVGMVCDMGDMNAISAMFDTIEAEHGPVSALVNNAGIAMPGNFLDYDLSNFDRVMDINLRGVFVAMQRAAKTMVEQGIEGTIVKHVVDQCAGRNPCDPRLLRVERRCHAADQGGSIGAGSEKHPC